MSSTKADISQIRAYLKGELDSRAMHELEKRAQSDPFLMDALEGFEVNGVYPDQISADLQQRLQNRVATKKVSLLSWRSAAAAAAIFLVCGSGLWWYLAQQQSQQVATVHSAVPVADSTRTAVGPSAVMPDAKIAAKSPEQLKQLASVVRKAPVANRRLVTVDSSANASVTIALPAEVNSSLAIAAVKPDTVKPAVAQGYFSARKTIILGEGKKIPTIKADSQQLVSRKLLSKAEGVEVNPDITQHSIAGRLLDGIDGQPLAGAQVKLKNLPAETLTDHNGNFHITAKDKDVLMLSSTGYETQEIKAGQKDTMNIALKPVQSSLSEVVVMNYGLRTKPNTKAEPLMGWQAYQSYLDHASSPDGRTGNVKLSVIVNPNGSLADITVTSGLSDAANQEAIRLIKQGPGWRGNPGGKPEQVKLKIRFR